MISYTVRVIFCVTLFILNNKAVNVSSFLYLFTVFDDGIQMFENILECAEKEFIQFGKKEREIKDLKRVIKSSLFNLKKTTTKHQRPIE